MAAFSSNNPNLAEKVKTNLQSIAEGIQRPAFADELSQLLIETGAVIAGGYVLGSIRDKLSDKSDLDIYVSHANFRPMLEYLLTIGQYEDINISSPYDSSFFHKNGIIARFSFAVNRTTNKGVDTATTLSSPVQRSVRAHKVLTRTPERPSSPPYEGYVYNYHGPNPTGHILHEGYLCQHADPAKPSDPIKDAREIVPPVTPSNKPVYRCMIELMVLKEDRSVIDTVSNFDFTFCEVWYDGRDVNGTHLEDALEGRGTLRKDYLPVFLNGNKFTLARYAKYLNRGYMISLDHVATPMSLPRVNLDPSYFLIAKTLTKFAKRSVYYNWRNYEYDRFKCKEDLMAFARLLTSQLDVFVNHALDNQEVMNHLKDVAKSTKISLPHSRYNGESHRDQVNKIIELCDMVLAVLG
jgi:hypothetical protein